MNGKFGLYDVLGKKQIIDCKYDNIGYFSEGLIPFSEAKFEFFYYFCVVSNKKIITT